MDPVTQSMYYTSMSHLQDLFKKISNKIMILSSSGFKTASDNKELSLLKEKIEVCTNALEKMKDHPPVNYYDGLSQVNDLTAYLGSKDGRL